MFERDGLFRWFGHGEGAVDALTFYLEAGAICRVGDKIYLDGDVRYDNQTCLSQPQVGTCTDTARLTPRVYLTVNL